jgi:hypothetical protein
LINDRAGQVWQQASGLASPGMVICEIDAGRNYALTLSAPLVSTASPFICAGHSDGTVTVWDAKVRHSLYCLVVIGLFIYLF